MADPQVIEHRLVNGNNAAMVFVHGFGGDPRATWENFPELLAADVELRGWDIFSLGYPTTLLLPDISNLWSAQPEIRTVSDELATRAELPPLQRYAALAFVAHSMGGLVVQRALVDWEALARRVSHVLLFGTPSFGLPRAGFFRFWKRQVRDMGVGSEFITVVRTSGANGSRSAITSVFWRWPATRMSSFRASRRSTASRRPDFRSLSGWSCPATTCRW